MDTLLDCAMEDRPHWLVQWGDEAASGELGKPSMRGCEHRTKASQTQCVNVVVN